MRERKVNEKAVEKTIAFLESLKFKFDNNLKISTTELQEEYEISKSTYSICKKLKFISGGKWVVDEPNRFHALQILEVLRQQSSKRTDMPLSGDFITAIERLTDSMKILSTHNEKSFKQPILSRALNQVEQHNGNHLFSQVQNDEAKRFELLKAIAGGVYSSYHDALSMATAQIINDFVLGASQDLFNKFFKVNDKQF